MLVVSYPKSASTSLTHTLAKILNLKCQRLSNLGTKIKNYDNLPHTDLVKLKPELVSNFFCNETVYQQHIAPIPSNINLINGIGKRFIITLRDPYESYQAYFRQPDLKKFVDLRAKRYGKDKYQACQNQLIDLYEKYKVWSKSNPNVLNVRYKDLSANNARSINACLEWLGSDKRVDNNFQLLKYRYTAGGKLKYKYEG